MTPEALEVSAERLRAHRMPETLAFETTESLPSLDAPVGQERAIAALKLGLEMQMGGFHVFVTGPAGTGRSFTVRKYLEMLTSGQPVPVDWGYLYSFQTPDHPVAVSLPAGRGQELARDLDALITTCRVEIPKAFDSETYRQRHRTIHERYDREGEQVLEESRHRAQEKGFLVQFTPAGFAIAPQRQGQPLTQEEYEALSQAERDKMDTQAAEVHAQVEETLRHIRSLQKQANDELEALNKDVAAFAVGHLITALRERYRELPRIQQHLDAIREDLQKQFALFLPQDSSDDLPEAFLEMRKKEIFNRYRANVIVDNSQAAHPPVLFEANPTYYNLLGKIDFRGEFGTMVTDFMLIKPGALERANGGFLVLDALDVLQSPYAWQALIRALRTREARIENLAEQYSLVPTTTLQPEPIPLTLKVVLIGEPVLYHTLFALDEDFRELFRIKADFDDEVVRTPENLTGFACFLATLCRERGLRHFHRDGVARFLEHSSRLREHQGKLSARLEDLSGLAIEASAWAEQESSPYIQASHVERAIEQQEYRANLLEQKLQEQILEGTLLVDDRGEAIGQVNGLSVYDLGDYAFARPSRVTAQTSLGAGGVVNIEREADLSGPIHNKGVLILEGYLAYKFAQDKPLALSASLAFEQSYSMVEGDSASSAELYALLSSLSRAPIRQGIAVTGSVNQHGEIQPVGGVTLKIEGFFRVCQSRGLTGDQGVLIPATNLPHLVLKEEVIQAVAANQFHIWAIRTVDEGIELLTGLDAGERGSDGRFPAESINGRVDATLCRYADCLREFGGGERSLNSQNGRQGRKPRPTPAPHTATWCYYGRKTLK